MDVVRDVDSLRAVLAPVRRAGRTVAAVPTMGALHDGHLSLIRLARAEAGPEGFVVVTLFVNPAQFGPSEDFSRYPRPFERDRDLCRAEGVDLLFAPTPEVVYAPDHSTWVDPGPIGEILEGSARPGHFRGVATVVAKLFGMVQPDLAVFGEKDYQQLQVLRRMVRDLNFPVRIVSGPTVRDDDGLALSSRNAYLTPEQRAAALALPRALQQAAVRFARGERDPAALCAAARKVLDTAAGVAVDYLEVRDAATLEPLAELDRPAVVLGAVRIGSTRLIDNLVLDPEAA